ncbi:unnamed protein product [Symbiodinium sp. CCMP2592]|nr:unnamed protein product [Symbiodinium sp. CCMP2592]
MEPYDWDAIREDEDKVLIPLTKASIMAGGVFERDDGFLKINSERGLLVVGTPKDWAGLQGGRLRAMLALCARMTKRTTIARSEEMQAIKNFIAGLPAFQAWAATSEPVGPTGGSEAELGEAVHVPGFTAESIDEEPEEDGVSAGGGGEATEETEEDAEMADKSADDTNDPGLEAAHVEDSEVPSPGMPKVSMEEEQKLLDRDAAPAPQRALQAQLEGMECADPALEVLQQQQKLKQKAREDKAAKLLARAEGSKAKAKAKGKGKKKGTSKEEADKASNSKPDETADADKPSDSKPDETTDADKASDSKPRESAETDEPTVCKQPTNSIDADDFDGLVRLISKLAPSVG